MKCPKCKQQFDLLLYKKKGICSSCGCKMYLSDAQINAIAREIALNDNDRQEKESDESPAPNTGMSDISVKASDSIQTGTFIDVTGPNKPNADANTYDRLFDDDDDPIEYESLPHDSNESADQSLEPDTSDNDSASDILNSNVKSCFFINRQTERLEYPNKDFNFNFDGFYDDTPVYDTIKNDTISRRDILNVLLTITGIILFILFLIWYA